MAGHLATLGVADDLIDDVRLVVTEAVSNVERHAYRSGPPGDFSVEVALDADVVTVLVSDDGVGPSPHFGVGGLGMGLPLMSAFAQKLEIKGDAENGTTVSMTFLLSPASLARGTNGRHPTC